jgi:epoxyqueuosine reductase
VLPAAYVDELCALGRANGLDAVGIAPASPMRRARASIQHRVDNGLHADMAFTFKNPARSTDPSRAVLGAQAIVVGARSYAADAPEPPGGPVGRVARYAWVEHYAPLREALWVVARRLRADGWKAVPFSDDNSLVDREAAYLAGLGWFGKNANLLVPAMGSYVVLGGVVTTAPLPLASGPVADGCGACRRCIDACPTGAIVAPGVVDANRCLAWLAQRPGVFPPEHRAALGDRIYGCDDCQESCPPTVRFSRSRPLPGAVAWVSLVDLLLADDDTLLARHGRWYLADRQPRWLRRNALIALGNVGDPADPAVVDALVRHLVHDDEVLRAHAAWAAVQIGRPDLLSVLDHDDSLVVCDELARLARS